MVYFNKIRFKIKKLLMGICCGFLLLLGGCSTEISTSVISQLLLAKKENCWPCTLYKAIWDTIGKVVTETFPTLCGTALTFLGVGLLFWICFTVGKLVVSIKEPNLKDFLTNMAGVLFKAIVMAVILSVSDRTLEILNLIVSTVLNAFVDLTLNIMYSDATIAKNLATASSRVELGDVISVGSYEKVFTAAIGNKIQDLVYRIYVGFHSGLSLGLHMATQSDISMMGMGMIVFVIFFYLMLVFPLLFIESFALLAAVIVFFPFILVLYVFPSTKNYITPFWKVLFVAMAQILVTGVYMAVMINVIQTYSDNVLSPVKIFSDPVLMLGLKNMNNEVLAFFALVYIMYKLSYDIPNISSRLLGDFNRSQMLAAIQRTINLGKNLGIAAGGLALGATGVVGAGMATGMVASAGDDMLKDVKAAGKDSNSSSGSSTGMSAAEQRAMTNQPQQK